MTRRVKQVVYGSFYACIWIALFFGFYTAFLKPAPSCMDGVKNGQEEEIDCGGPSCISCEIKHLPAIQVLPVKTLVGVDPQHTATVVEIRNPNAGYGTEKFSYLLSVTGSSTTAPYVEQVDVPVYPSELKYRINLGVPIPFSPNVKATVTLRTVNVDWKSAGDVPKPKLPMRDVSKVVTRNTVVVNGFVRNDNPFLMRHVTVNVLFETADGKLLSVSKTIVNDLFASEERGFQVVAPLPAGYTDKTLPEPRVIIDGERG